MEFETEWKDSRLIHCGKRHHWHMTPTLQLKRNRNQWIDVTECSDIRKNDAQVQFSRSFKEPAALRVMHNAQVRLIMAIAQITINSQEK